MLQKFWMNIVSWPFLLVSDVIWTRTSGCAPSRACSFYGLPSFLTASPFIVTIYPFYSDLPFHWSWIYLWRAHWVEFSDPVSDLWVYIQSDPKSKSKSIRMYVWDFMDYYLGHNAFLTCTPRFTYQCSVIFKISYIPWNASA